MRTTSSTLRKLAAEGLGTACSLRPLSDRRAGATFGAKLTTQDGRTRPKADIRTAWQVFVTRPAGALARGLVQAGHHPPVTWESEPARLRPMLRERKLDVGEYFPRDAT